MKNVQYLSSVRWVSKTNETIKGTLSSDINLVGTDKNLPSAWIAEIWSLHKYMFNM